MIDESNPAGRLYKILCLAQQVRYKTIIEGWSNILETETNSIAVITALTELRSLSDEAQYLIKTQPELNHDLYLDWIDKINNVIMPQNLNLGASWDGTVRSSLKEGSLTSLKFCANKISEFHVEELLSDTEFETIVTKTNELFNVVSNSALPDSVKCILLTEIERLRHATAMYKIKGTAGMKKALQDTIGALIVNKTELKEISEDNDMSTLAKFQETMGFIATTIKFSEVVSKLISFF